MSSSASKRVPELAQEGQLWCLLIKLLYLGWRVASCWCVLEALLRADLLNNKLFRYCYCFGIFEANLFCTDASITATRRFLTWAPTMGTGGMPGLAIMVIG